MTGSIPRPRIDDAVLEELKSRQPLSEVFRQFGVSLRRQGREYWACCSWHAERTPSLKIDDAKGHFYCFGCSASGDVFDALAHFRGGDFLSAVDFLGGAREITAEDRARIEKEKADRRRQEIADRQRTQSKVERVWGETQPLHGTDAARYLLNRGLAPTRQQAGDLRFHPALPYYGYPNAEADDISALGTYPAMVAAIRDETRVIIGLHRTYLAPGGTGKLAIGDTTRNSAKKIMGEHLGGLIWFVESRGMLAVGEGIETTLAWLALGGGGEGDCGLACGISLGNISGAATGSLPHPTQENRWIPNGDPDLEATAMVLPEHVTELVLLGDGDSDPASTKARLLVAIRRFNARGIAVYTSMAPHGKDFNDVLLETMENDA